MSKATWPSANEVINLQQYPIEDLTAPAAQALIRRCQDDLNIRGACELKNFVTDWGLSQLVAESVGLEPYAFHNSLSANAYLDEPGPEYPADHVRRMVEPTSLGVIAYDQFPQSSLLRKIYEWDPMMHFIGRVIGIPQIFRYADPMGALNLSVMKDGDYLRWHFDQTDFVSSLAIRSAEEGGDFEYVRMIRTADQENYDRVRAVLNGRSNEVVEVENSPGSLVLFRGRYSLHRVTPIRGHVSRLIGLFGFDSKPGVVSSDHLRRIRYGRTEVMQPV